MEELAPNLFAKVPARVVRSRTVKEALQGAWLTDCGPDLNERALREYLALWGRLANVELDAESKDEASWRWSMDGEFSAKTAYAAFFQGQV